MRKLLKQVHTTLEGICACFSRHWLFSSKKDHFCTSTSLVAPNLSLYSRNGEKGAEHIEAALAARNSRFCRALRLLLLFSLHFSASQPLWSFKKLEAHEENQRRKTNSRCLCTAKIPATMICTNFDPYICKYTYMHLPGWEWPRFCLFCFSWVVKGSRMQTTHKKQWHLRLFG